MHLNIAPNVVNVTKSALSQQQQQHWHPTQGYKMVCPVDSEQAITNGEIGGGSPHRQN